MGDAAPATADPPVSGPTDVEQEPVGRDGVHAMREHGHVDSAFVELRGEQA
ncbi:MAG: hypothetical protein M3460_28130 [Actinomycetota bacterium]|nr:hypothetical protein [Actinomycetota bacterium]